MLAMADGSKSTHSSLPHHPDNLSDVHTSPLTTSSVNMPSSVGTNLAAAVTAAATLANGSNMYWPNPQAAALAAVMGLPTAHQQYQMLLYQRLENSFAAAAAAASLAAAAANPVVNPSMTAQQQLPPVAPIMPPPPLEVINPSTMKSTIPSVATVSPKNPNSTTVKQENHTVTTTITNSPRVTTPKRSSTPSPTQDGDSASKRSCLELTQGSHIQLPLRIPNSLLEELREAYVDAIPNAKLSANAVKTLPPLPCTKSGCMCISDLQALLNAGDVSLLQKFFDTHAVGENVSFQLDFSGLFAKGSSSAGEALAHEFESRSGTVMDHGDHPVYHEFRGTDCIISYFNAMLQSIPDTVWLCWDETSGPVNEDGTREVSCNCRLIGVKVYDMEVIHNQEFDDEQSRIELAIAGLTSLSSHGPSKSSDDQLKMRMKRGGETTNASVRNLSSMRLMIAQNDVIFRVGSKLSKEMHINYVGTFTWTLNKDNKALRMRYSIHSNDVKKE